MPIDAPSFMHSVESVLTLALIGAVGYFLAVRHWFSPESNLLITRLVTTVALPPFLLYNVNTGLTRDQLTRLAHGLIVPYVSIITMLVVSTAAARLLKVPRNRKGIFCTSCSFSNTMYIGLPVNLALFGEAALPYLLLYYFANSSLFWIVGNYMLAADGEGTQTKIFSAATAKRILSPPMIGFLIGVSLLLLEIRLPSVVRNTASMLGGITTPLALISIGVTLHQIGLCKIRPSAHLLYILFSRFILSALVLIALMRFFPLPDMMRKIFIIQATLPTMTTTAMLSSFYKSDSEFAAVTVSATTLLSMGTIPVFMMIVGQL